MSGAAREAAIAAALGFGDAPVRRSFGAVRYALHPHCLRGVDRGLSAFALDGGQGQGQGQGQGEGESEGEGGEHKGAAAGAGAGGGGGAGAGQAPSLAQTLVRAAFSPSVLPGPLIEYADAEAKDECCDLCSRGGGALQLFSLSPLVSALAPPSERGYRAHPPCIFWLAHSRLLDPPGAPAPPGTSAAAGYAPVAAGYAAAEAGPGLGPGPAPLSRFDHLLNRWRCGLCGRHGGLTTRCAAAGCAVRCHPLCAQLAGPGWMLCAFGGGFGGAGAGAGAGAGGGGEPLGLLCCAHSNQQLYN